MGLDDFASGRILRSAGARRNDDMSRVFALLASFSIRTSMTCDPASWSICGIRPPDRGGKESRPLDSGESSEPSGPGFTGDPGMSTRPSIALAVIALLGLVSSCPGGEFVPLVKGDDVQAFELVGISPGSIKIEEGEVRLTGKPN